MDKRREVLDWAFFTIAVVALGIVLYDRLRAPPNLDPLAPRTERVRDWAALSQDAAVVVDGLAQQRQLAGAYAIPTNGTPFRVADRAVEVTIFTDFECPFCASSDSVLAGLGQQFIVVRKIVHFPNPGHIHAYRAARAFECAERDWQGAEMARALFRHQADFGASSWASFAAEAEVEDTVRFNTCMEDTVGVGRIEAGIALAKKLKVSATPTTLVNGTIIFPSTPQAIWDAVEEIAHPGTKAQRERVRTREAAAAQERRAEQVHDSTRRIP